MAPNQPSFGFLRSRRVNRPIVNHSCSTPPPSYTSHDRTLGHHEDHRIEVVDNRPLQSPEPFSKRDQVRLELKEKIRDLIQQTLDLKMQLNIQKDRIESLKEHGLVKTEQIKDLSHQLKERNTSAELHASKNLNEPGYIKECKDWEVERLEFENRELKRLNKMSKEEEKALRRDNKALRCDLEGVRSEVQLLRREKLKEKVKRRVDIVGKELEEGSLERQYGLIIEKVDR